MGLQSCSQTLGDCESARLLPELEMSTPTPQKQGITRHHDRGVMGVGIEE